MKFDRCDGGCGSERTEAYAKLSDNWVEVFVSARNLRNLRCREQMVFCPACWMQLEKHMIAAARLQLLPEKANQ